MKKVLLLLMTVTFFYGCTYVDPAERIEYKPDEAVAKLPGILMTTVHNSHKKAYDTALPSGSISATEAGRTESTDIQIKYVKETLVETGITVVGAFKIDLTNGTIGGDLVVVYKNYTKDGITLNGDLRIASNILISGYTCDISSINVSVLYDRHDYGCLLDLKQTVTYTENKMTLKGKITHELDKVYDIEETQAILVDQNT